MVSLRQQLISEFNMAAILIGIPVMIQDTHEYDDSCFSRQL